MFFKVRKSLIARLPGAAAAQLGSCSNWKGMDYVLQS
jgi:hypothetical protein